MTAVTTESRSDFLATQELYDRHLFMQAYRACEHKWIAKADLENYPVEELVLAARLAARLGGTRISRWLFWKLQLLQPTHPAVRLARLYFRSRKRNLLDDLRAFEQTPELENANAELAAQWFAMHGAIFGQLRDFERAYKCLDRAVELNGSDYWVWCCKAQVLSVEDRWDEALEAAEHASKLSPGAPGVAHSLGQTLLNLGRAEEAATRLTEAAQIGESQEVNVLACWHQCVVAERLEGDQRSQILETARSLARRAEELAILRDRESSAMLARVNLDIAALGDDHDEMERWALQARLPNYRKVLENLKRNSGGRRLRLRHQRAKQRYQECLPTSIASALSVANAEIDTRSMAEEITFGGTHFWAAAEWLEERGFTVRMFAVTPALATKLVKAGISFVLGLATDDLRHAVNVVGLDERTETLLLHDPSVFRTVEILTGNIGDKETPLGPIGMAIVPKHEKESLDELLPKEDCLAITAMSQHQLAQARRLTNAATEIVNNLERTLPGHPVTRYLGALEDIAEGHPHQALNELKDLVKSYSGSPLVRASLLQASRSLGNTALLRKTLAEVVESRSLPGIEVQQQWRYPPRTYVCQLVDLLRQSAETRPRAKRLLQTALRREPHGADAWYVLGNLLLHEYDFAGRLLAYRIASCLQPNNETFARSYCDALARNGSKKEGLAWLEERARKYGRGSTPAAASPWINLAGALEYWGDPERALAACAEAVELHPESASLHSFLAAFYARMAMWTEAEASREALKKIGNQALCEEAATVISRTRGELSDAIEHCQKWVEHSPRSASAKQTLLQLIGKRDGARSALGMAQEWCFNEPGNDDLERVYLSQLDASFAPRWKPDLLLWRRTKRNSEDAWAWRELAFRRMASFDYADAAHRTKLIPRINKILAECERTAPEDPATLRARAWWCEKNGRWTEAIEIYTQSIKLDPSTAFSYQRLFVCAVRVREQQSALEQIEAELRDCPGRIPFVHDVMFAIARSEGVATAELLLERLREARPDDPDVIQALADMLVQLGHGRSDARRALEIAQPAIKSFPFHLGLRMSFINASQKLGELAPAEQELREVIRRYPDNVGAHLQLAGLLDRLGKREEVGPIMEAVAAKNPRSVELWSQRVQMLGRNKQYQEARRAIAKGLEVAPDAVAWRGRAISMLLGYGDLEGAVQAAREGVAIFPRGAYLWFLLANALNQARKLARPGEIEECLRTSLRFNSNLVESADLLAAILVEQGRWEDAEHALKSLFERQADVSPLRGRLAWIRRMKGDKQAAIQEMQQVVKDYPSYRWGWTVLMDWIEKDQAWEVGMSAMNEVPAPLRSDTNFRKRRLGILDRCGLPKPQVEAEWESLLSDFPEDLGLHLLRYDSLRQQDRRKECADVLRRIESVDPSNSFLRARSVQVLLDEGRKEEASKTTLSIWFAELETSPSPVDTTWNALQDNGMAKTVYELARQRFETGARPTPQAMYVMAKHALGEVKGSGSIQPAWRTWVPQKGAREVLSMLKGLRQDSARDQILIAVLLKQLAASGYHTNVVRYAKANPLVQQSNIDVWAQLGLSLIRSGRRAQARKLLSSWKERRGIQMWMMTNYVYCCPRIGRQSRQHLRAICWEALTKLRHDHCAKYLAHVLAESQLILGDREGLYETLDKYRALFDGVTKNHEYFPNGQKYLLDAIHQLATEPKEKLAGHSKRTGWWLGLKQIPFIVRSTLKN